MKQAMKGALAVLALIAVVVLVMAMPVGLAVAQETGSPPGDTPITLIEITTVVIGSVFAVLTVFFGVRASKWKNAAFEIRDMAVEFKRAVEPGSPGGRSIVQSEWASIFDEQGDVSEEVAIVLRE